MEIKVSALKVKQKAKVTSPPVSVFKQSSRYNNNSDITNNDDSAVIDNSIRDLTCLSSNHDVDEQIKSQQIIAIIDKLSNKMMTKIDENDQILKRIADIDSLIEEEVSKFRS